MKFRSLLTLWIAAAQLFSCVDLPQVEPGTCGNGVVEPGEDCDGYEPDRQLCREPDSKNGGACRWDCSLNEKAKDGKGPPDCPSDMSCGRDAICHAGQGTYASWNDRLIPKQANDLRLGDLDGDGLDELVTFGTATPNWQTIPNVLFFDEFGIESAPTYNPQTWISSPMLAPIDPGPGRKPRQQIVASTGFGVAVLEGGGNQEISARAFPFQTIPEGTEYRLVRIYGVANRALHEDVLIYLSAAGQSVLSAASSDDTLGVLERAPSELSGLPVAGNYDAEPTSPCDELVFAYKSDGTVRGLELCDSNGKLQPFSGLRALASLPEGHLPSTGAMLAHINDDAHLDLVVADQLGCPYVSFGAGNGQFAASIDSPSSTAGQMWPVVIADGSCPQEPERPAAEYPLAIGDLDEDGWPDWVLPGGIHFVSKVSPELGHIRIDGSPFGAPFKLWSVARIAELTGDRHPDLVAGSAEVSDLDFLIGNGRARPNPAIIETDGPVTDIAIGDYDGIPVNDIAFIQRHPITSTDPHAPTNGLAIAYGTSGALPTDVSEIARFNRVEQLVSANYEDSDAVEEIGVLARSPDNATTQLTMFVGNPGRHPISSLGLWRVITQYSPEGLPLQMWSVGGSPVASTVGHFLDHDRYGILALALDDCHELPCKLEFRLWYAPDANKSDLAAPSEAISETGFLPYREEARELAVHFVVGPLEPMVPGRSPPLDGALMLTAGPYEDHISLWRVTLPLTPNPLMHLSSTEGKLTAKSSPLLVDLDADGQRDLALLLTKPHELQQSLAIVWNEGGSFDLERAEYVHLDGTSVHSIAKGSVGNSSGLLVATDNAIQLLEWTKGRKHGTETLKFSNGISLPGGRALAVGDVNGDGLMDVALAVPDGISVFRQLEKAPNPKEHP